MASKSRLDQRVKEPRIMSLCVFVISSFCIASPCCMHCSLFHTLLDLFACLLFSIKQAHGCGFCLAFFGFFMAFFLVEIADGIGWQWMAVDGRITLFFFGGGR